MTRGWPSSKNCRGAGTVPGGSIRTTRCRSSWKWLLFLEVSSGLALALFREFVEFSASLWFVFLSCCGFVVGVACAPYIGVRPLSIESKTF